MGCCASAATNAASAAVQLPSSLVSYFPSIDDFLKNSKAQLPVLGILRLDRKVPGPIPGSFDHPGSFDYEVKHRVVAGLTPELCQSGEPLKGEMEAAFRKGITDLHAKGACVITGDTGFMMWYQSLARQSTKLPVILSSLASLPTITCSYSKEEQVAIFTTSVKTLEMMDGLLRDECGVSIHDTRYVFVGIDEIPGFESIALGQHADSRTMEAGLCQKAAEVLEQHPKVRAFLLECNELPRYADALRRATGRPVFDAMKLCDFYIDSLLDNPRFGIKDWDDALNKKSAEFDFGQSLAVAAQLITKPVLLARDVALQVYAASMQHAVSMMVRSRRQGIKLGVVRLDYHYEPAPGDVDHPGSYAYEVHYQMVPGLTFELCQSGKMTKEVEVELLKAIGALESKGVSVITGDCGFMMWYQELVRTSTRLPVIMSSLATLPAITSSFHKGEQIAIFTANGKSLLPMEELIKAECAVDLKDERYVFVGCEDIPGFEAVALGEKVDVRKVTPGMVKKAQDVLREHPKVRAFLMECTELPPYSDAVRHATGLPVFDAITACDFYISSHLDNVKMAVDLSNPFWLV